jgi:hypothetical protein
MEQTTTDRRGRLCYFINPTQDPKEHGGYVPSAVYENESGHFPMLGQGDYAQPWLWGETLAGAEAIADKINREDLGLSPRDVDQIISRSMLLGRIN